MNHKQRSVLVDLAHRSVIREKYEYRVIGQTGDVTVTVYELEELGHVRLRRDGSYVLTESGSKIAREITAGKSRGRGRGVSFSDEAVGADHS